MNKLLLYIYCLFVNQSDECSIEYWKELAETRREALADTLRENEQVHI